MKIVRTFDESGKIVHVHEVSPNTGLLIEGDIFSSYMVTNTVVPIRDRLSPVDPTCIIGIAQNYKQHAREMGSSVPERPVFFMKLPSSAQHPLKPIILPESAGSKKVDFEAELGVIIGKKCHNVPVESALDHVLGYTCANDVSARDWQKEWGGGQFCRGKSFDTFCPFGPRIVCTDEIPDPSKLRITGKLNGTEMQSSTVDDLIFSVPELISFLSESTTLPAGSLILTGTPSGVGTARVPPVYLKDGDTFSVEIEKIGILSNPISTEPAID